MSGRTVRVLLVDDSDVFRDAAAEVVVRTPGFELVGTAGSGEEAVSVLPAAAPDLVLMDHRMRGLSGVEAARRIRAEHPGVVVAIITADSASDVERNAFAVVSKRDFSSRTVVELWQRRVGEPAASP